VSIQIETDGERFRVDTRIAPDGSLTCDFAWLNGPEGYGFSIGTGPQLTETQMAELITTPALEKQARDFVTAFFADDGIGPADFPTFVARRRGDRSV